MQVGLLYIPSFSILNYEPAFYLYSIMSIFSQHIHKEGKISWIVTLYAFF